MKTFLSILAVVNACILTLNAAAIRQPLELREGEEYRLAFVTSEKRDATSSDIHDYDSFVQQVADASAQIGEWGINWRVIGSTDSVGAQEHTETHPVDDPSVPIYRLNWQAKRV